MNCIDLHIHTTASDGTDSPRAAVEKAASLGLAAVSITDHDSVSGVPEAMRAGAELGVEVVPGIEVSSDYRDNNVHILGYFIDPAAPELRPVLDWVKTERDERNEKDRRHVRARPGLISPSRSCARNTRIPCLAAALLRASDAQGLHLLREGWV